MISTELSCEERTCMGALVASYAAIFDAQAGTLAGAPMSARRLSDLAGVFADEASYAAALAQSDPVVYTTASAATANGEGQLHYGLGTLLPGRVGDEYFCTKGHLHAWRPAAEVYVGLAGEGAMLLEDERSGETRLELLGANRIVYVPGFTAHRTINTGDAPLVYLGVYDAAAGHDYGTIERRNFRMVVVARDGAPALLERAAYLASLRPSSQGA
jgi:glucose-6-phosphate isomerase